MHSRSSRSIDSRQGVWKLQALIQPQREDSQTTSPFYASVPFTGLTFLASSQPASWADLRRKTMSIAPAPPNLFQFSDRKKGDEGEEDDQGTGKPFGVESGHKLINGSHWT
jgi:hypothetical protein